VAGSWRGVGGGGGDEASFDRVAAVVDDEGLRGDRGRARGGRGGTRHDVMLIRWSVLSSSFSALSISFFFASGAMGVHSFAGSVRFSAYNGFFLCWRRFPSEGLKWACSCGLAA